MTPAPLRPGTAVNRANGDAYDAYLTARGWERGMAPSDPIEIWNVHVDGRGCVSARCTWVRDDLLAEERDWLHARFGAQPPCERRSAA